MDFVINGVVSLVILSIVVIIGLFAMIGKKRLIAKYAFIIALLSGFLVTTPIIIANYRIHATRSYLMDVFQSLAKSGPPFPQDIESFMEEDPHVLFPHGYWVGDDQLKFEIYYKQGSDSFTLPYPSQDWEWRGFNYQGPETDN